MNEFNISALLMCLLITSINYTLECGEKENEQRLAQGSVSSFEQLFVHINFFFYVVINFIE